jgi:hypothetical protein
MFSKPAAALSQRLAPVARPAGLHMREMGLQRRQGFLRERHNLGVGAVLRLCAELGDVRLMVASHLAQEGRVECLA